MKTFCISTLGCKVNQYESEQIATLLRHRGLIAVQQPQAADLRIVNSCSVTIQAASKSRQTARQMVRLPVLNSSQTSLTDSDQSPSSRCADRQRVIITGCWATSDKAEAAQLPGVSAVIGHHDDVAHELNRLLTLWQTEDQTPPARATMLHTTIQEQLPESLGDDGWINQAGTPTIPFTADNKPYPPHRVKRNLAEKKDRRSGTTTLPLLQQHQDSRQRGFLKIQDGCDAHCTYCIIPRLRPRLWSKPIEDVLEEARNLVDSGHVELILTGIFLSAYGQPTALRRRQPQTTAKPLAHLVEALCTRVPGLRRLRLSSLEPGDLSDDLLAILRSHPQIVPHFHLPLQSGSNLLLRRMNRQYTRDDYLRMLQQIHRRFDRPALTTDIIVGFPGESADEFARTVEVVDQARFIHIHAFSYSPRPGTAAARWTTDFIHGPAIHERIELLRQRAMDHSFNYRQQFLGETVELLVERPPENDASQFALAKHPHHGRCERYFTVHFQSPNAIPGQPVTARIDRVTPEHTFGTLVYNRQS